MACHRHTASGSYLAAFLLELPDHKELGWETLEGEWLPINGDTQMEAMDFTVALGSLRSLSNRLPKREGQNRLWQSRHLSHSFSISLFLFLMALSRQVLPPEPLGPKPSEPILKNIQHKKGQGWGS
jgi:hypothetical protein